MPYFDNFMPQSSINNTALRFFWWWCLDGLYKVRGRITKYFKKHILQNNVEQISRQDDNQCRHAEEDADESPCHHLFEQRGFRN